MKKILFAIVIFTHSHLLAQNSIVSCGGQAIGTGGAVSYSIGQISYSSISESGWHITQGVQQPYEISIITGINDIDNQIKIQAYPNPTSNNLILSIPNQEIKNLYYKLIDIQGRIIIEERINQKTEHINLYKMNAGIYMLSIFNSKQKIKTLQIIKNK